MVRGDQHIRVTPCKNQARSEPSVMRRRASLALDLGCSAGVCVCTGIRSLLVGFAPLWRGWRHPTRSRGGARFRLLGFRGLSVLVVRLTDSSSFHFSKKKERPYWSMQGRVLNAGPCTQCRAAYRAVCRTVCSMLGRMLNGGPYASKLMPTCLLFLFEMMIFRNSIRSGTDFYCL